MKIWVNKLIDELIRYFRPRIQFERELNRGRDHLTKTKAGSLLRVKKSSDPFFLDEGSYITFLDLDEGDWTLGADIIYLYNGEKYNKYVRYDNFHNLFEVVDTDQLS